MGFSVLSGCFASRRDSETSLRRQKEGQDEEGRAGDYFSFLEFVQGK